MLERRAPEQGEDTQKVASNLLRVALLPVAFWGRTLPYLFFLEEDFHSLSLLVSCLWGTVSAGLKRGVRPNFYQSWNNILNGILYLIIFTSYVFLPKCSWQFKTERVKDQKTKDSTKNKQKSHAPLPVFPMTGWSPAPPPPVSVMRRSNPSF